jgi:cytochrome c peroxidase
VETQPATYSAFDHFSLIQKFINPLFLFNQKLINQYRVTSRSLVDYSLNKKEITIFDKALFSGQNSKGIFHRITNPDALAEVERLGKLLFFDPILSGNNQRSCASCHNPATFFTDTIATTSFKFNREGFLGRNTPSLINAQYNHLLMSDGRHILLQDQTKGVLINAEEMNCSEKEVVEKVLSCPDYRTGFKQLLKYTPTEKEISIDHIVSAVTLYYSTLSQYYSPFDKAMNSDIELDASAKKGFNLFMSKAQCATCHFVPQFNGVKPPYTGSEFEVLGTPSDSSFSSLSSDMGRYSVNPAAEMKNAFRTGTVRNAAFTAPYMHNGVFRNLKQVIDFYDAGGGAGRGLQVPNQTLSPEGLGLTEEEKYNLIKFIHSLSEDVPVVKSPEKLPRSEIKYLNNRKAGGEY